MSFKVTIAEISPPWLQNNAYGQLLASFGQGIDNFVAQLKEGIKARFPDYAPDDALGYIGNDRSIERGPGETALSYKVRLREAVDSNRNRGGVRTLLRQLSGYFSGTALPGLRCVGSNAVWQTFDWDTLTSTKTIVRTNWDWDGENHWWWGWVIIDASSLGASFRDSWGATFATPGGSTSYVTTTPELGDLFVVYATFAENTEDAPTCTDDNGGTYTLVECLEYYSGASRFAVFVRDQLLENTTSTVVTVTSAGTNTSTAIAVVAVAGMSKAGLLAIRSSGSQENQAAATPSATLNQAALTTNVTIAAAAAPWSPSIVSPPTGWTEREEVGTTTGGTVTSGLEVATRDSGFTGTAITWPDASSFNWAAHVLELDADPWIQPGNNFGEPDGGEFDDGATFGSTATVDQVQSIQRIVQKWKPANVYVSRIIVTFDAALYTVANARPDNPDGEMGDEANFSTDACYWLGGGEETATEITGSFRPTPADLKLWTEGQYTSDVLGGTWPDRAGLGFLVTAGSANPTPGNYQSPNFDGTNDYIVAVSTANLIFGSVFSFVALVNADTLAAFSTVTGSESLFANAGQDIGLIVTTSGAKLWMNDGAVKETAFVPFEAEKWILLRGKWTGTELFLARGRDDFAGGVACGAPGGWADSLYFGSNYNQTAFFDGTLGAFILAQASWTDDEFEDHTAYLEYRFGMRLD